MREPLAWSLPLGRLFGTNIRVHIILPLVGLGMWLRVVTDKDAPPEIGAAAAAVLGLMFLSILLHEFGHVFTARAVGGDADEILLWPLGGLAFADVPHSPRPHLLTALGGPAVNLALCALSAGVLVAIGVWPPLNPFTSDPYFPQLTTWLDGEVNSTWYLTLAARMFWVNWVLFWFALLPAYPLDGGRALHAVLWARTDFREALTTAAYVGFVTMLCLFVVAIFRDSVLLFALSVFIYLNCRQQILQTETGSDDSPLGYDFSQGYTSLNKEAAAPPRRRPNFLQRWLQRRAAQRAQRDLQEREAEERRMDELLEKVQQHGLTALTDEERRFLNRVSARYRK